ncbi:MAG: hypothetical protein EOO15_06815 [Chitinophagaceae bacterium]|nr:MAG: hypothetical protein EOO15_06815 [Chitinophagaceae bacterium]
MYSSRTLRSIAAIFCLFTALIAQAQPSGYIVRADGDTVRGTFPGYRSRAFNPNEVSFNDGTGSRKYGVADLRSFTIDGGEEYRSYQGARITNPLVVETTGLDQTAENFAPLSSFLRVFARASGYTFYVHNDLQRINFFYASAADTVTELKQWAYSAPNSLENSESGIFRAQLTKLFGENPGRLAYEEEALRTWINAVGGNGKKTKRQRSADEGWVLLGGVSANKLQARGFTNDRDFKGNQSPYLAAGYVLRLERRFERFFLLPQLSYHSYRAEARTTSSGETEVITGKGYGLGVGCYLGIRLVSKPSVKVFVAPGVDALFYVDNNLTYRYEYDPSYPFAQRGQNEFKLKTLSMSPRILAGVEVKRIWAWGAYRLSSSISDLQLLGVHLSGLQAGLGYRF